MRGRTFAFIGCVSIRKARPGEQGRGEGDWPSTGNASACNAEEYLIDEAMEGPVGGEVT